MLTLENAELKNDTRLAKIVGVKLPENNDDLNNRDELIDLFKITNTYDNCLNIIDLCQPVNLFG